MKKIITASLVAASAAFGATDAQIIEFYKGMLGGKQDITVTVSDRQKISEKSDIEVVTVTMSDGKVSQDDVIFTRGDLLFPEVVDMKEQKSYLGEFKQKLTVKGISKVYNKEDKANIITIGNDPKKPTIVVFSDPECPYCRAELDKIEATLKDSNVQMILTPVHDKSALQKSFLAYKDAAKAKSDSEKIKALRKYFAADYTVDEKAVSDEDVKKMDELRTKYLAAGVRSVPFIIDASELKK